MPESQFEIDADSLSIEEMEMVEDVVGVSFEEIMEGKARSTKVMRAFALLALRRINPGATLEDAGKVTVSGLNKLLGGPLEPQKAAPVGSRTSSRSRKHPASPSKT